MKFLSPGVLLFVLASISCSKKEKVGTVSKSGNSYIGAASCQSCHSSIYSNFLETDHFHTSGTIDPDSLSALLSHNINSLQLSENITYKIVEEGDQHFQEGYIGDSLAAKAPFHLVIGSGNRGRTFLYWDEDMLFQLPISQNAKSGAWVNSPGYPLDRINFKRPVNPGCMECHSTNMAPMRHVLGRKNVFDKEKSMFGITCERCHGPGKEHVVFHRNNPEEKESKYILKYESLDRSRKLEACALCHSGSRIHLKDPFSFQIGDSLDAFSIAKNSNANANTLDVHANQFGLLKSSKCFQNSPEMDCSTCHDVHKNQKKDLKAFNMKCVSCHSKNKTIDCGKIKDHAMVTASNCVDCHMPNLNTSKIFVFDPNNRDTVGFSMRTHRIAIYEKENLAQIQAYIQGL